MAEPQYAELLTPAHNYAVVQLPERQYPGVVVQGDSLAIICELLASAIAGDAEATAEVKADLDDVLRSYLAVLEQRSINPPFLYRPPER